MICSFCGRSYKGKGKMIVHRKGDVTYLCSSKCEKNWKLKRNPRRAKWTDTAHKAKAELNVAQKKSAKG